MAHQSDPFDKRAAPLEHDIFAFPAGTVSVLYTQAVLFECNFEFLHMNMICLQSQHEKSLHSIHQFCFLRADSCISPAHCVNSCTSVSYASGVSGEVLGQWMQELDANASLAASLRIVAAFLEAQWLLAFALSADWLFICLQ